MSFEITKDFINDTIPYRGKGPLVGRVFGNKDEYRGHLFRLSDDDGVLYYEGYCSEESHAPLDWALPRYGCTQIEYQCGSTKNGGDTWWEVL